LTLYFFTDAFIDSPVAYTLGWPGVSPGFPEIIFKSLLAVHRWYELKDEARKFANQGSGEPGLKE
jgi:hypothetical protein